MADTTTPVQSTDLQGAVTTLLNTLASHEAVETDTLQAAFDQHKADQEQIAKDAQNLVTDEDQIKADADNKTAEDAMLSQAELNAASPAIISSLDAVTNALLSGQPLPAFPGAPTPDPVPPVQAEPVPPVQADPVPPVQADPVPPVQADPVPPETPAPA